MDETIEELGRKSFRVIQPAKGFRFGMDSVLLADFARVRRGERAADLCAGCGAISLMLAAREETATVDAVEIDGYMADLARRNAEMNGISNRMRAFNEDIRQCPKTFGYGKYTLIVCNPPYFGGSGSAAKHLGKLTLEDVAQAASSLLEPRGRACFVFPAFGIIDLALALRSKNLEPKRMRGVCHDETRAPKLMLIEAVKNAASGVEWLPPLYTAPNSPEMDRIYNS